MFTLQHLATIRNAEIDKIASFLAPGTRILEIGAGTGQQSLALARRGYNVTAIDIPASGYTPNRVFPIVDYDGKTIPLPDRSFDVVFSSSVLEHVPDLARMHAEVRRVLKPGGYCIHVLPTHVWRFWQTLTSYVEATVCLAMAVPQLLPHGLPRRDERRLGRAWGTTVRRAGGLCFPRRHGERGNVVSELWLFHPRWWRRNFRENGFIVASDEPMGLFYTGHMLLGGRLSLKRRQQLALWFGSACHMFKLLPDADRSDGVTRSWR